MNDDLSLAELRALTRRKHRAAGNKVSRLKQTKGALVGGTKKDVRRDPTNIKGYTRKQLITYLGQLNTFNDRKTQYVGDFKGRPMEGGLMKKYTKLQDKFNQFRAEQFDKVKHNILHIEQGKQVSLEERMKQITPDHAMAGNPSTTNPNRPLDRQSSQITSERALKKLTKALEKQMDSRANDREIKAIKKEADDILEVVADEELRKKLAGLSDEQFRTLWYYTNFATKLSTIYETIMNNRRGNKTSYDDKLMEDSLSEAYQLAGEAKGYTIADKN